MAFIETAQKLDWVRPQIDIKPINPGERRKVVSYCLKSGHDAFIPEASFVS